MRKTLLALAAVATLSAGLAHAEAVTYAFDPSHTHVTFEIGHFGTSTNRGRFDKNSGSAQLDLAAKSGMVDVTTDVTSINTGWDAFNKHLQSPDLFDAAQYPTMNFKGSKFSFNGDKVASIAGDLTLHGQTHPVTLNAVNFNCYDSPMLKRQVCGGDFEGTIDRTQWGVNYGIDWGFPKNVRVLVQVEGVKQ